MNQSDKTFRELFAGDRRRADGAAARQPIRRTPASADYTGIEVEKYLNCATTQETYFRAGVNNRTREKLKKKKFAVEGQCDLHGSRCEEALHQVVQFVRQAQADGKQCVLIVFGKGLSSKGGRPVLKPAVLSCLQDRHEVLGYAPALYDGGSGAAYVLLRSPGQ